MRIIAAVLLFVACTSVPPATSTSEPSVSIGSELVVTGTITDEGVECTAMRDAAGKLYTLARAASDPPLQPGDRVRVTGTIAEVSSCMQGTTIAVTKLEKL